MVNRKPFPRFSFKKLAKLCLILLLLLNIVAAFHAYKFTHFSQAEIIKTKDPAKLTTIDKLQTALLGVSNPKPHSTIVPTQKFETIKLQSNQLLDCWFIKQDPAIGTVILFHGFGGEKSSLIEQSNEFLKMGYNTFLVDFMGAGNSTGTQVTIGFKEAQNVKDSYGFVKSKGETNIILFGTSMGAVAIMKAIKEYQLQPASIILECPFCSMYKTTAARFKMMKIPAFPMAGLLVFWGGVENGFWAFGHNPDEYSKSINCPSLLIYGAQDPKVSKEETEAIYQNLAGKKQLKIYPLAGHADYFLNYRANWVNDVQSFLQINKMPPLAK